MPEQKMGTKVEQGEELGAKRRGGTVLPTATAEVEGQIPEPSRVVCPWCGAAQYVYLDSAFYKWITCRACGGSFRA